MSSAATDALATHGWWLASRASGLVALVLVTISVLLGLTMAGKVMRKPGLGRKLMAAHEHTALAGLVAIAVHGITLLGDPWLNPGPAGVAVPFQMGYRPLFTGLGIIAGYLAALLGLSFYARRRIGTRLWRKAHRFTIVVYVLGVVHALGAGTDASTSVAALVAARHRRPDPWLFVYRVAGLAAAVGADRRRRRSVPPCAAIPATEEAR